MRKVEQQMLAAISARKTRSMGNTMVRSDPVKGMCVYLHGNLIAVVSDAKLSVTLAGWNTPTTRSRVNRILYEFARSVNGHGPRVFQYQHEPYLTTDVTSRAAERVIGSDEWLSFATKVWC